MNNIEFIDRYRVRLHKIWSDEEKDTAECIGFQSQGDMVSLWGLSLRL